MNKDLKEKFGFTLGATHVSISHNTRRVAFTLAEVLITLGIIGIVSAMTIPTLVKKYQEITYNTSAEVFSQKLTEALKIMNIQSTLVGYTTTEDFVMELGKHLKIVNMWVEEYTIDEIKSAVLDSLKAKKLHLRYADAILASRNKKRETIDEVDEEAAELLAGIYVKK